MSHNNQNPDLNPNAASFAPRRARGFSAESGFSGLPLPTTDPGSSDVPVTANELSAQLGRLGINGTIPESQMPPNPETSAQPDNRRPLPPYQRSLPADPRSQPVHSGPQSQYNGRIARIRGANTQNNGNIAAVDPRPPIHRGFKTYYPDDPSYEDAVDWFHNGRGRGRQWRDPQPVEQMPAPAVITPQRQPVKPAPAMIPPQREPAMAAIQLMLARNRGQGFPIQQQVRPHQRQNGGPSQPQVQGGLGNSNDSVPYQEYKF